MHSRSGKCCSAAELTELAQYTGFVEVEHRRTAEDRSAILPSNPAD